MEFPINLIKQVSMDPEHAEEKMTANKVPESAEFEQKDSDLPMKPESHNLLGSSALHVSPGGDWSERLPHSYTDILGGYGLKRFVTSSVEAESPYTNPYSMNDAGPVVGELKLRNYKPPNLDSVSPSNIREGVHSRQSQWKHQYHLSSERSSRNTHDAFWCSEKDQTLLSAREDLQRTHSSVKDIKLTSKQNNLDETCAYLEYGSEKINPTNTLPLEGNQSKILPSSSFSQFFAKKYLKLKGVVSRSEVLTEFSPATAGQNNEEQVFVTGSLSDVILNSSAKNDNSTRYNIDRVCFEPCHDEISLREWLTLECHEVNKVERLLLFRQIVQLVDFAHCQGIVLLDLRPSYFILFPLRRVKYIGASRMFHQIECGVMYQDINRKRPLEQELHSHNNLGLKLQKLGENTRPVGHQPQFFSKRSVIGEAMNEIDANGSDRQDLGYTEHEAQNISSYQNACTSIHQLSNSANVQLEEKWYASPEELRERASLSSNIYSLGVLLFELLCCFESSEVHFAAMLGLRHRILPPHFLSENPMETGFCLWLLHPDPSSRPTTREIMQSQLICGYEELYPGPGDDSSSCFDNGDHTESELLLHFLLSLKEEKEKGAAKLAQDVGFLEADIKEIERRRITSTSSYSMDRELPDGRKWGPHLEALTDSNVHSRSFSMSNMVDGWLTRNFTELENAYFSVRFQTQLTDTTATEHVDKDLLRNRERWSRLQNENEHSMDGKPVGHLKAFSEGLCKFARYNKFEVCGTLRNGGLLSSANVICSLSFDRDEDYVAAAGVSKKIKIFEFGALLNDSLDIHYPVVEMINKSKLSCVCWNNYIRNYLASTDYDGVVQMWDASTGQGLARFIEHQKRAWSVDFSQVHPKKFASGSDDCSVKLWSISEKNSASTIWSPANVCCVQFSAYSSHLLAFGSADYKIYCYDLRNTRIPWCSLTGHQKSVSYVKFLDSETLVSSSTDNTLKLWDLKKTSSEGLSSDACTLTFSGHANEKNFVGLSVFEGYISCGSETNEVYTYHRSMPMPITSHKFGCVDPISGHEVDDDSGQFVSSVCWRGRSNMIVAANSSGSMKLLRMV